MKKQLLVEGKDDQNVVWALCEKYGLPETFKVIDSKGIDEVFKGIPERIKSGSLDVLGIVIDADTDLQKRWQTVKSIFELFDYQLPTMPSVEGTIVNHPDENTIYPLRIEIWLMPNNQVSGILEDFMQLLTDQDNTLWSLTMESVEKVEQMVEGLQRFQQKDRSKALIHTYLAWQQDPGTPLGLSITKKYFDANAALAQQFIKWLNDLFN